MALLIQLMEQLLLKPYCAAGVGEPDVVDSSGQGFYDLLSSFRTCRRLRYLMNGCANAIAFVAGNAGCASAINGVACDFLESAVGHYSDFPPAQAEPELGKYVRRLGDEVSRVGA